MHSAGHKLCGPRFQKTAVELGPLYGFVSTTFGAGDICFAKSYYLPQTSHTWNEGRALLYVRPGPPRPRESLFSFLIPLRYTKQKRDSRKDAEPQRTQSSCSQAYRFYFKVLLKSNIQDPKFIVS